MNGKENLIEIIEKYIKLKEAEKNLIRESLKPLFLKKGSLLLEKGSHITPVGFLESGLMRSFYWNEEGDEITSGFFLEGKICTDLNSFQKGGKNERSVEALMDCQLWILDQFDIHKLQSELENWPYFEQRYIADLLLQKVNFQREMSRANTAESYELFLRTYKQAALFAPRYQIASFLGISPFTLSRISNR
ncbi:MAG: Crp/Fnr family transcriptional regulator [Bacteroidia bacterium]|nr:Crp/Fnr family transcriptional regulator [Bacteroidia bacterium]